MSARAASNRIDDRSIHRETSVVTVDAPNDLALIHDPGVALVHWQRAMPAALREGLESIADGTLPHVRFSAPLRAVEQATVAAFEAAGIGSSVARHLLIGDIVLLAILYSHVEQAEWLSVRLERIDHDACRKPHVDRVTTRLLCTYRGAGTEFGQTGVENEDWQCDLSLRRFDVGLVKGLLHPSARSSDTSKLLHRSPRFTADSQERFLLCIGSAEPPRPRARDAGLLH